MLPLYVLFVLLLLAVSFAETSLLACTAHQDTIFLLEIAYLAHRFRTVLIAPIMQPVLHAFLALP